MSREERITYNQRLWGGSSSNSSSSGFTGSSSGTSAEDDYMERVRDEHNDMMRRRRRRRLQLLSTAGALMTQAAIEIEDVDTDKRGGSVQGREYTFRDGGDFSKQKIMRDYFTTPCRWPPHKFRRRYRMTRELFMYMLHTVASFDDYFKDKVDGLGRQAISGLQKGLAAVAQLATGCSSDSTDEYLQIGDSTANVSMKCWCKAIITAFEEEYLRRPSEADTARILAENAARGFPGMLGSIDCMHWVWKNCPSGWAGTHVGYKKEPTLILEAVADKHCWIWHCFFGLPGSHNDINVLHRSHVFESLEQGEAPAVAFNVNGNDYDMGYYLADGIYPKWGTFVQAIRYPRNKHEKIFTQRQEAARKDVERTFGVLQARWHIVKASARCHSVVVLGDIMKACIIMHNMIVENERESGVWNWKGQRKETIPALFQEDDGFHFVYQMIEARNKIRNEVTHTNLQKDLVEHVFNWTGIEETADPVPIYDPNWSDPDEGEGGEN